MSAFLLPIFLQLVGIVVIIAEIIIPSGGLLSVVAAGLIGYALYLVFTGFTMAAGMAFVAADLILIPIALIVGIKLLAKSPATLKKELARTDGVVAQAPGLEALIGAAGIALTDLRPAGTALINGERADVVTRGDYIEKETAIRVVTVTGNQIVVAKV